MRPLTVRMEWSSGPLFCRGRPESGCLGGGESRLRGVEAELEGCLEGGLAEVGEEVADCLLGLVDDLAGLGLVDRLCHRLTELLEGAAHLRQQVLRRQLG